MVLQVIIPMAGVGSRFKDYGFLTNKYLLPINLDMNYMIEKAITSLEINIDCVYYFIINEENGIDSSLRAILDTICKKYNYNYHIYSVDKLTEGPASTVYSIIDILNPFDPLLVSNSDQVLDWNFNEFYNKSIHYDGCVLTYTPDYPLVKGSQDKHSFIRLNENDEIVECKEKIVLSNHALVGVHYFKNTNIFKEAYQYMVYKNIRAPNGEFYLSLVYQSMIEKHYKIGYYDLYSQSKEKNEYFYPVGEPTDYFKYLYTQGGYIHNVEKIKENKVIYKNDHFMIEYIFSPIYDESENSLFFDKETITDIPDSFLSNYIKLTIKGYKPQNKKWLVNDFIRGWFIGDFLPNIIKVKEFEIGLLSHNISSHNDNFHYHKEADEINFLVEGKMKINEKTIEKNTLFIIPKNQLSCPIFLENCKVLCIKIPSVPSDKYIL